MVEKYAIRGDFDWQNGKHWAAIELQNRAKSVLVIPKCALGDTLEKEREM